MSDCFRVFFRRNRQFFDVHLHSVSPVTFHRRGGGRWGYFSPTLENSRFGKFGEIHLVRSRVRADVVAHELDHLRLAWIFQNGIILSTHNEEWFCKFGDELTRKFWREYEKYQKENPDV